MCNNKVTSRILLEKCRKMTRIKLYPPSQTPLTGEEEVATPFRHEGQKIKLPWVNK